MAGRVPNQLVIAVPFQPGKSHIGGIENRAEQALGLGMISEMPTISTRESKVNGWLIVLDVLPDDRPFWFGFYLGKDWIIDNHASFA